MSRGSYFELLKESRDQKRGVEICRACKPKAQDEANGADPFILKRLEDGRFFPSDSSWDLVLDEKDGTCYDSVLHLEFNSIFSSLREHYEEFENLNSYGNDRHVISRDEAVEMVRAIDYILLGKYDKGFEDVLGNEYVEIFGDLDREYSLWKYRQTFPEDTEYRGTDIDDLRSSLREIRTILDAYLIATRDPDENAGRYLLTYVVWG